MSAEQEPRTLAGALRKGLLRDLEPGTYRIEYNDRTHLSEDSWRPLLMINVSARASRIRGLSAEQYPFYTIASALTSVGEPALAEDAAQAAKGGKGVLTPEAVRAKADKAEKDGAKLRDLLGQCLLRTGILPAITESEVDRVLARLSRKAALVLIPDTNALANGVIHHLLRVLSQTQVWLMPVSVSLTTIQQRDSGLKSMMKETKPGNIQQALRSRNLINSSLSLLERCRAHTQVLEADPQLLRYMRPAGSNSQDPDQGDVLEDRLLVEAIHTTLGAMRTKAERRVVTSDGFLSRVLHAEGVATLILQPPRLPDVAVACLRYDPLARAFVGATLPTLLWDLSHTFASVRLVRASDAKTSPTARLDTYWDGKTASDWKQERLYITMAPPEVSSNTHFSAAPLPEAPLLHVLRLGGMLIQGSGSLEDLRARFPEDSRPSEEIVRASCETLLRANFASLSGGVLTGTGLLQALDDVFATEDLDKASEGMEASYPPYKVLLDALRERGKISYDELPEVLRSATDDRRPSRRACKLLARAAVLLGQAWPHKDGLGDGTKRPSDEEVTETIGRLLEKHARDGFMSVKSLLSKVGESLKMSPWAVTQRLQRADVMSKLPRLGVSASLGGRPARLSVPVLRGRLAEVQEVEIPLDRLKVGNSLIYSFTWSPA